MVFDPVSMGLAAASILGPLFGGGSKQPKPLTPEQLRKMFGPGALDKDTQEIFRRLLSSPYGQQLLQGAGTQGQEFERALGLNAARAGFGAGGGAESGASIFSNAAAGGAQNAFERQARGDIFGTALTQAQQLLRDRMQAYLGERQSFGTPQPGIGERVGQAAGTALALMPARTQSGVERVGAVTPLTNRSRQLPAETAGISLLPQKYTGPQQDMGFNQFQTAYQPRRFGR